MTPRELQVLKIIYQLGGQASLRMISKKTGLSLDYSRELAKFLLRKHFLSQPTSRLLALTVQGRLLITGRPARTEETAIFGLAKAARMVSQQTDIAPTLPPEPNWFSPEFVEEPASFIKHDLNKNQTIELEDTRSIQAGIAGLISINSKRSRRVK